MQSRFGDTTARGVGHVFALLEIDQVAVKGRSQPETIWTVAGEQPMLLDETYCQLRAAVDAYRRQDWDKAEDAYRRAGDIRLASLDPAGLRDVFLGRIAQYRKHPPPADWDGVYVATSK